MNIIKFIFSSFGFAAIAMILGITFQIASVKLDNSFLQTLTWVCFGYVAATILFNLLEPVCIWIWSKINKTNK